MCDSHENWRALLTFMGSTRDAKGKTVPPRGPPRARYQGATSEERALGKVRGPWDPSLLSRPLPQTGVSKGGIAGVSKAKMPAPT